MTKRPIIHFEIPAQDRAAAANFYKELAGWEFQEVPQLNYTTVNTGNVPGGLFQKTPEQPGILSLYIQSDDVDADLKKAESLGGKIVIPTMEIPGVGWVGFFTDLDGNIVGLARYLQQPTTA
jgi:predicted enzyme related to lactoylglutathione lyase